MGDHDGLAEVLQHIGSTLPPPQVALLSRWIAEGGESSRSDRSRAAALVPSPTFRTCVAQLWAAWSREPETPASAIALGLRVAALTSERLRSSNSLEVVWTGPTSPDVPIRHSAQVIGQLIERARRQLIVVSFAAHGIPELNDLLRAAAARRVAVHLVLETEADSGGELARDAAAALEELQGAATFWTWPRSRRPAAGAVLHAKCVVADRSAALVTSANLTGRAMTRNMELGLLVNGGPTPRRLADHFTSLMARGDLESIQGA